MKGFAARWLNRTSVAPGAPTASSRDPATPRLRVLLTSFNLSFRGGSALYVRDIAMGLLRRGHAPIVYSPELGEVAAEMRALTIPVVSDLNDLAVAPDVIHGQQHLETMTALLHFNDTPAVAYCHGWLAWQEAPPIFPRILQYVAVDDLCRDRLVYENGIAPERVKVLLNFVDLKRFRPRGALPAQPSKALVFSNGMDDSGLRSLRQACARAGLQLDVVGASAGAVVANPESVLPRYDIVFAKARAAIEAMAVGCAVVVCDVNGLAGMVTSKNFAALRNLNFGARTLSRPLEPDLLYEAIRSYSAGDATRVAETIRRTADVEDTVDELIGLYRKVIDEYRGLEKDPRQELRASAAYLHKWSQQFTGSIVAAPLTTATESLPYNDDWVGVELRLRREIPPNAQFLLLSGMSPGLLHSTGSTQVLHASLDNIYLGAVVIPAAGEFEAGWKLPRHLAYPERIGDAVKHEVLVTASSAFVPSQLMNSNDTRRLSFQFKALSFAQEPAPQVRVAESERDSAAASSEG